MTEAVSGIVGNTQQAAAEATVAREATKVAWQEQIFTHMVIGFVLLIISYLLLTSLEWTFAWKIGAGIALIYLGGKIATVSAKLKWYWPNIIRGVGIGIILLSLLQSGFAQLLGSGINQLEKAAAGVVTPVEPLAPEEHARRVALAQQEAEILAAQQAAMAAAERKAELDAEKARPEAAIVRKDCGGDYAKLNNCRNVYFGQNEKYFVESAKGICPVADPSNAVNWEHLGGNQYVVTPHTDKGVRVTFFEMKVGETFGGYTCK